MGYNKVYGNVKTRTIAEAYFIVENTATIRETATAFGVSKSTVHRDMKMHLVELDQVLYDKVSDIISFNKAERHIRGGQATKLKMSKKS
jgi:putative DeoR family transcriptional regulator (stage III sporulation protein D)